MSDKQIALVTGAGRARTLGVGGTIADRQQAARLVVQHAEVHAVGQRRRAAREILQPIGRGGIGPVQPLDGLMQAGGPIRDFVFMWGRRSGTRARTRRRRAPPTRPRASRASAARSRARQDGAGTARPDSMTVLASGQSPSCSLSACSIACCRRIVNCSRSDSATAGSGATIVSRRPLASVSSAAARLPLSTDEMYRGASGASVCDVVPVEQWPSKLLEALDRRERRRRRVGELAGPDEPEVVAPPAPPSRLMPMLVGDVRCATTSPGAILDVVRRQSVVGGAANVVEVSPRLATPTAARNSAIGRADLLPARHDGLAEPVGEQRRHDPQQQDRKAAGSARGWRTATTTSATAANSGLASICFTNSASPCARPAVLRRDGRRRLPLEHLAMRHRHARERDRDGVGHLGGLVRHERQLEPGTRQRGPHVVDKVAQEHAPRAASGRGPARVRPATDNGENASAARATGVQCRGLPGRTDPAGSRGRRSRARPGCASGCRGSSSAK